MNGLIFDAYKMLLAFKRPRWLKLYMLSFKKSRLNFVLVLSEEILPKLLKLSLLQAAGILERPCYAHRRNGQFSMHDVKSICESLIENKTQNAMAYDDERISLVNSGPIAEVILKDIDVRVSFKASSWYVDVWVPEAFRDKTEGLCGNYNDDTADDLISSTGETYPNNPFGQYNYSLDWIIDDEYCDSEPHFIEVQFELKDIPYVT